MTLFGLFFEIYLSGLVALGNSLNTEQFNILYCTGFSFDNVHYHVIQENYFYIITQNSDHLRPVKIEHM